MSEGAPARKPRLRQLAMGLVAALLPLVVFDVALGLIALRDGSFRQAPVPPYDLIFSETAREKLHGPPDPYGRFDAELGWSIRPGGVSRNGLARANSDGIRGDREYPLDPPADRVRVATFGDSFTHGDEVSNSDMWQADLERARPELEVINFGVNGFGTDQSYLRYRRDGRPYNPHVVVIGIMAENILRNVSVYRPAYYHGTGGTAVKPRFALDDREKLVLAPCPVSTREELQTVLETRALLPVLLETDYWVQRAPRAYTGSPLFLSSLFRILYSRYENAGRDPLPYYADTGSEPFRVTARVLEAFHAEAIDDGARQAYVLIFPSPPALRAAAAADSPWSKPWKTLTDRLQTNGIPVIDVTDALAVRARERGLETLVELSGHYSAGGNDVVAEVLAERLP